MVAPTVLTMESLYLSTLGPGGVCNLPLSQLDQIHCHAHIYKSSKQCLVQWIAEAQFKTLYKKCGSGLFLLLVRFLQCTVTKLPMCGFWWVWSGQL